MFLDVSSTNTPSLGLLHQPLELRDFTIRPTCVSSFLELSSRISTLVVSGAIFAIQSNNGGINTTVLKLISH